MTFKQGLTLIITLGIVIGGWIFVDDRYEKKFARADELKKTNQQLQLTNYQHRQHILQEQAFYYQRQMNAIKNACGTDNVHKMPIGYKKRYQEYEIDLKRVDIDLKNLQQGKQ